MFAGMFFTNGVTLTVTSIVAWVIFWGSLSIAIAATWRRASYLWLPIGIVGPVAPLLALIAGLAARKRAKNVK